MHIAMEKARAVQQQAENRTIIAADTIVVLKNDIIGKPKDREDAIHILTRLNGTAHQVITGVAIKKETRRLVFMMLLMSIFIHYSGTDHFLCRQVPAFR
jgi:septum formation protein